MIGQSTSISRAEGRQRVLTVTDYIIQFCLVMYALFAPHSIAITQGSYLLGALAWAVQLVLTRRFRDMRTPLDIALFGFFACCTVSSFLSYYPLGSLNGLRSPAFFLAFYFVSSRIKSLKFARTLAFLMVGSCLLNVAYSGLKLVIGKGVRIDSFQKGSALAKAGLEPGDVILKADDREVNKPEDLSRVIDSGRGQIDLLFKRVEAVSDVFASRQALRTTPGAGVERLRIASSKGRNFRVTGFYSHYETYAEVLALIASLAVGMLVSLPVKKSKTGVFLAASAVLISSALVMTSTRSALAALGISVVMMALASFRPRIILIAMVALVIAAPVAVWKVRHSRGVGFIDPTEGSTQYRLEVWREALWLIQGNPIVGIGKGSEGKLREKLGLYENGKLPPGHFHSSLIQVAAWWGLPALMLYIAFMVIMLIEIWRLASRLRVSGDWRSWGLALGVFGALIAFHVNSLVQFNFGDGEVVMALWLLAGMAFAVRRLEREGASGSTMPPTQALPSAGTSGKSPRLEREETAGGTGRAAAVTGN